MSISHCCISCRTLMLAAPLAAKQLAFVRKGVLGYALCLAKTSYTCRMNDLAKSWIRPTRSRWACSSSARANVLDGKMTFYGGRAANNHSTMFGGADTRGKNGPTPRSQERAKLPSFARFAAATLILPPPQKKTKDSCCCAALISKRCRELPGGFFLFVRTEAGYSLNECYFRIHSL